MKKIKIKICNYDPNDTCSYGFYFLSILKKYYNIELSEDPDYLFFNHTNFEHLNYDCVKIFYTGENLHPNFNLCDYAIAFDYMDFGDRYYRLPIYQVATFYREKELRDADNDFTKQKPFTKEDLAAKTDFCSFVYSNYLGDGSRKEFFDKLSTYRKVNAGGAYLNNIGGRVDNKLEFESKHKFSIAFENSSRSGYTTEKLPTALAARTIPIYWGNPDIAKEFNEKRFVNCHAYSSFEEVIERIKEIDNNDELYLSMVNEPVVVDNKMEETRLGLEKFLRNIFNQQLAESKRRKINPAIEKDILNNERMIARLNEKKNSRKRFLAAIYKPFKRFKLLEKFKQQYFAKKVLKK